MKPLKFLSIIASIMLLYITLLFTPLNLNAQSSKEIMIDSIYLNNELLLFDNDQCNLDLKYNDVIKLVGRATKGTNVSITFANDKYTSVTDEMGNWMILFSIPYIEDGKYQIIQESYEDSYCEISLNNKVVDETEKDEVKPFKSIYIISLISIVSISFGLYLFLSKKKKHKSKR